MCLRINFCGIIFKIFFFQLEINISKHMLILYICQNNKLPQSTYLNEK